MIAALVPVKQLADSKSRLLAELGPGERAALTLAMLGDVVAALRACTAIDRVAVVTPDEDVAAAAEAEGAEVVCFTEPGLGPALAAGAAALSLGPEDALLVVLGDVAGALPGDLDRLCAQLAGASGPLAVLAPSSDGGTAALLRRPPDAFPARFGHDSARRHREAAAEADVALRELALPSLALDLDSRADVVRFLATHEGGARTRAALSRFDGFTTTADPAGELPA